MIYKNYCPNIRLFLHNMVTEVMHLAINVYLDGGKPDTSGRFNIKEVSLWCRLLTIANCWDQINIEFSLTSNTILEWKLRKTILHVA